MGHKLRNFRLQRNMTQEDLAERSGVSRQTISSIENEGVGAVTTKTLAKLAEALETTVGELFFKDSV